MFRNGLLSIMPLLITTALFTPPAAAAEIHEAAQAGDRAVELFKPHAKRATRPEVLGGLGGFAGLFALKRKVETL